MTGVEPLALDTIVFARGLSTADGATPGLDRIDLDILPGEIFSIVGRAGSGKTALLEALVGLTPCSADRLTVCGNDPRQFPNAVKQRIGVAPGRVAVERKITVEETLRLFASFYERADPEATIARLELRDVRHRAVDSLPPAAMQRVSLALALLNDPVVLFADEPTRDLEPEGVRLVWHLLRERRERGRTSVITTNHLDEAARLSDRVAVIRDGRLVAVDTPAALIASSASTSVQIVIDLLTPDLKADDLGTIEAVVDVQQDKAHYTVTSSDGVATLRAVLRLLESAHLRPLNISMRQQTLEDVFFALTAPEGAAL